MEYIENVKDLALSTSPQERPRTDMDSCSIQTPLSIFLSPAATCCNGSFLLRPLRE